MSNKEKLKLATKRLALSWEFLKDTFAEIAELMSSFFRKLFKLS